MLVTAPAACVVFYFAMLEVMCMHFPPRFVPPPDNDSTAAYDYPRRNWRAYQRGDAAEPIYVLIADDLEARKATDLKARHMRGATYYINSSDGVAYKDPIELSEVLKGTWRRLDTDLIIYPLDEKDRQDQKTPWNNVMQAVDAAYCAGFRRVFFRPPRVYW